MKSKRTLIVPDIDECIITAYDRDAIHELLHEASKRMLRFEGIDSLKGYDREWQDWVLSRNPVDMVGRKSIGAYVFVKKNRTAKKIMPYARVE